VIYAEPTDSTATSFVTIRCLGRARDKPCQSKISLNLELQTLYCTWTEQPPAWLPPDYA
jgi:hypothetical protein